MNVVVAPPGILGSLSFYTAAVAGPDSGGLRDSQVSPQGSRSRLRRSDRRTILFWTAITIKSRKKWKSSIDGSFCSRCPGGGDTCVHSVRSRRKTFLSSAPASPTAHLEERKAQIYENLRDLQFEYRLGKLSDADYQKTKVDLQLELARVLADIDAVQPPVPAQPERVKPIKVSVSEKCPHCGAKFPQPLKFCGECGKAMA